MSHQHNFNQTLTPLPDETDVLNLLVDSLQDDREHLRSLARIIHSKTMGNTLFVIQFLANLYRRSLVRFDWYDRRAISYVLICDRNLQKWVWDTNGIEQIGYTDGLVSFFLNIFHDLSAEALNLIVFASLLGMHYSAKISSVLILN